MRKCPEYILEMVRGYDRNLAVEWDEQGRAWFLVDRGERLFALEHPDGTAIRNIDGCGGEVLEVVRRTDLARTGKQAFRRRGAWLRRRQRDTEERAAAQGKEELTAAGLDVLRWKRTGNTPMIGGKLRKDVSHG